jgi:hypothetical protein
MEKIFFFFFAPLPLFFPFSRSQSGPKDDPRGPAFTPMASAIASRSPAVDAPTPAP